MVTKSLQTEGLPRYGRFYYICEICINPTQRRTEMLRSKRVCTACLAFLQIYLGRTQVSKMKKIGLFYIVFFLAVGFLSNSVAQEYTQWHLPEGAIARLGKGKIKDVEFSPDGTRLAVATDIGIWIYNAHTGAEITRIKRQPRGIQTVNTIAFAPDSTTLAVGYWVPGGAAGAVKLWDTTTEERLTVLEEDMGSVHALEFSADGTTIASVGWAPIEYRMWQIATGREVLSFTKAQDLIPHSKGALVLSQDTHSIASTDVDTVRIWDVATEGLQQILEGDKNLALTLAFSPDSKTLAGGFQTIRLWDTKTGNELSKLDGHTNLVYTMTFSPDAKILASGDIRGKVILWDLDSSNPKPLKKKSTLPSLLRSITGDKSSKTNNTRENHTLIEHTLSIEALDFTTDSRMLVSGSQDGAAIVWEVETGNRFFTVTGHTGSVKALAFLEDDKTVISASSDGTLRIWETGTDNQQLIPIKHNRSIFCMAFSADRKTVAIGGVGNDVHLWNADTKNFVATFKTGHKNYVDTLAFSPDDKILATGSRDRKVELWDVPNHQRLSILDGYTDGIIEMTFSADGKKFASRSRDGTAHLSDLDTEKKTVLVTAPNSGVNALAFSPDSSLLVSGCSDEKIQLWDANTHQHIADSIVSPIVHHLEFSPDGKTVVTGTQYGLILLWDVDTRTVIRQIRMGDAALPTAFAFTQDGKTLVSGCSDGTIFIWDLEYITQR